jgi:hypothetical protein
LVKRYEYIEQSQVKFEWFVPENLFVAEKDTENPLFVILDSGRGGIKEIYNPFEKKSTLFIDFLSLSPTPQAVAGFIEQWGTLRGGGVWMEPEEFLDMPVVTFRNGEPWENMPNHNPQEMRLEVHETLLPLTQKQLLYELNEDNQRQKERTPPQKEEPFIRHSESFDFWVREIWNMATTFQVWRIVNERDTELLRRVMFVKPLRDNNLSRYLNVFETRLVLTNLPQEVTLTFQDAEALYRKAVKGTSQDIIALRSCLPEGVPLLVAEINTGFLATKGDNLEDIKDTLFSMLLDQVSLKVNCYLKRGVYPVVWREKDGLMVYLKPRDLLSAMWLQFYFVLVGEKRIKRCSICGLWEDVTDKTKAWSKHVECAQRERFRKYYHEKLKRARELYREGKSPEEIASLLGKDVEWVRKRLEKIKGSFEGEE